MGGEAFGFFDPKGLPAATGGEEEVLPPRDEVARELEHLKWFLWHGHVFQALEALRVVEFVLKGAVCETAMPRHASRTRWCESSLPFTHFPVMAPGIPSCKICMERG
jgi:hypothetical protein